MKFFKKNLTKDLKKTVESYKTNTEQYYTLGKKPKTLKQKIEKYKLK